MPYTMFQSTKDNRFYILLFGATLGTVVVLVNYLKQKKKKQVQKQANDYLKCTSLTDFEQLAKQLMRKHRYDYYDYKAGEAHTYQACREYFNKQLRIMPRALINVLEVSLQTTIFGHIYESPIMIAPTAFHCLAHPDGEVATARGATEAQCCYTYNWMLSNIPEEKVLRTSGPKFLHVYLTISKDLLQNIVQKADQKGYRAIVVTCDHPTDRVQDYTFPFLEDASKHLDPELLTHIPLPNLNVDTILADEEENLSGSKTWADIEWLRTLTKLPIICKGILSPIDAELAMKYGADGIIVSNHGCRQVDTAPPAIECLEGIVNIVDGRIEVFLDTGIRSGTDVLKALALGARAVFIGRPILYGLACGGQHGVQRVLDILKHELIYDMKCCGVTTIQQINKDILYKHI